MEGRAWGAVQRWKLWEVSEAGEQGFGSVVGHRAGQVGCNVRFSAVGGC